LPPGLAQFHIAELPVRGITNSLNVAMTGSIVLYELLARWKK
jgi:tRNA G18 (ribose-2'-O)-methylase SpoU